jgi:RNase P subunit RPR2
MYKMAVELKGYDIHRELVKRIILLSNKFLVRIPVQIKRSICYKCNRIRIPKINCETEIERKGKDYHLKVNCICGYIKKYKVT